MRAIYVAVKKKPREELLERISGKIIILPTLLGRLEDIVSRKV